MIRHIETKRWKMLLPLVLVVCLLLTSVPALASEDNVPERVSLTVAADDDGLDGTEISLYKVAEFTSDGHYQLNEPYATYLGNANFDGSDSKKLTGGATTLEAYVRPEKREADSKAVIANRQAVFTDIPAGLYLILSDVPEESPYTVGALLQSLPYDFKDGGYVGSITLHVKAEKKPEKTSYKVQKLWQGDTKAERPSEISVTILKDKKYYDTVKLNASNNWSYSWEAESGVFLVKEDSVPDGYTVNITSDGTTFQITNSRKQETTSPTTQTGTTEAASRTRKRTTPGQSSTPTQPATTDQTGTPTQPATPTQPGTPTQPATPAQPGTPTQPAETIQNGTTVPHAGQETGTVQAVQQTTGSSGTVSTGDHSRIFGWLFLMCTSGLVLVIAGWRMARR